MTLLEIIKKILSNYKKAGGYNGLLEDTRNKAEKDKDWRISEVYQPLASGVTFSPFRDVTLGDWAFYSPRNQGQSNSCVANSMAKVLEVKKFGQSKELVKFSHAPIYKKRANKPHAGMAMIDALKIVVASSSCKETDFPSELKTDEQLDASPFPVNYEELNNIIKPNTYLTESFMSFKDAADLVNKEKAIVIFVSTDNANYTKRAIPQAGGRNGNINHAITVVDAITYEGVDYLVAEDSWGIGFIEKTDPLSTLCSNRGQRLLTKEFWNDAVYNVGLPTRFEYNVTDGNVINKSDPFYSVMKFGDDSYDVKRLQEYLKKKGLFPSNTNTTTYYGNITARAVYAFQTANNVASPSELLALQGKRVGQKTLDFINKNL